MKFLIGFLLSVEDNEITIGKKNMIEHLLTHTTTDMKTIASLTDSELCRMYDSISDGSSDNAIEIDRYEDDPFADSESEDENKNQKGAVPAIEIASYSNSRGSKRSSISSTKSFKKTNGEFE